MGPTTNHFTERSTPSRLSAWDAIISQIDTLKEEGHDLSVRWVPGHPERRHSQLHDWTYFDGAIFAADKLAARRASGYNNQECNYEDLWKALGVKGDDQKASEIKFLELIEKVL